jgi:hypothetical protein
VKYLDLAAPGRAFLQIAEENPLIAKAAEWSDEREWRMLVPLENAARVLPGEAGAIHLFDFDREAVRAVILGPCASDDTAGRVQRLIAQTPELRHVRIRKAVPERTRAALSIVELGG